MRIWLMNNIIKKTTSHLLKNETWKRERGKTEMEYSSAEKPFSSIPFALIAILMAVSWVLVPRASAAPYSIEQITDNSTGDWFSQINDAGQLAWSGYDGSDYEIFFYEPTDGITQLTNNSYDDSAAQINDAGQVVWEGFDGSDWEIFLYDPTDGTTQLTDNSYDDNYPQVNDSGQVVWQGYDGSDAEIFIYDPTDGTTQLSDNSYDDNYPQVNDSGQVVWQGYDGSDAEIFIYDSTDGTTQLSDNSYLQREPQINSAGQVVWWGFDGTDWEVYLYDPTDGTSQLSISPYNTNGYPKINDNGQVAWHGNDGTGWEIFFYDPVEGTTQLTDNSYSDIGAQINDAGQVVWAVRESIGADAEVFVYDPARGITQLTDNSHDDSLYQINNTGQIVWSGIHGLDRKIFLATPIPVVTIVTVAIDIKPRSDLNIINLNAGSVAVAILSDGGNGFDATTLIPESIDMHGAGVKQVGKGNKYLCNTRDANHDGLKDLVCQMDLDKASLDNNATEVTLTAETTGGQSIEGIDSIQVVP
jgi:hypothetical protein